MPDGNQTGQDRPILKAVHQALMTSSGASIRSLVDSDEVGFRRHAHAPSYLDGLTQDDTEAGIIQIVKDLAEGNESLMRQVSELRKEQDRMRNALFAMAQILDDKLNKKEDEGGIDELLERH